MVLYDIHEATANSSVEEVKDLLEQDSNNANKLDNCQRSPLLTAAVLGNIEIASLLLKHGADILAVENKYHHSALHYAAFMGQASMIPVLLKYGAEINAIDIYGCTPLHLAIDSGDISTFKALVDQNADICHKDNSGLSVIEKVIVIQREGMMKCIIDKLKLQPSVEEVTIKLKPMLDVNALD